MPSIPVQQYESKVGVPRDVPRGDVYEAPRLVNSGVGQAAQELSSTIGGIVQRETVRREDQSLTDYDIALSKLDQKSWLGDDQTPGAVAAKGRNAEGVTTRTLSAWDKEAEALTPKLRTPEAQARAAQKRAVRRQDLQARLAQHELGESTAAETETFQSAKTTYQDEALASADDQAAVDASLARGRSAIAAHGARMGWDQVTTTQQLADWESGTVRSVIASQLQRDPLKALATFKAQVDTLRGDDRLAIEGALKPYVLEAQGRALGDSLYQGGAPTVAAGTPSLYDAIASAESGNRQFDERGAVLRGPVTSSGERAVGRFQIMPATGPEAARLAGVEWNPKRFETDEVYHAQLGRAYIDQQVARFNGNVPAVAAAYNMGPEAAAAWVAGKPYRTQSGKQWTPKGPMDPEAMPAETRDYIAKVTGRMGGDAAARAPGAVDPRDAAKHSEAEALRRADAIADPDERRATMERIHQLAAFDQLALAERERTAQAGRAELDDRYQNAVAKLQDGVPVPLSERPTREQLVAAHGEVDGGNRYVEMETAARVGPDVMKLRVATPAEASAIVASYKPNPDSAHYALESKAQQIVGNAWQKVQEARTADPMLYAAQNRLYGVAAIDPTKPDGQWAARDRAAQLMTERYGTPYRLLSKDEATAYTGQLAGATAAEKLQLLEQTRTGLTDRGFQAVMGQVAGDQPLTAAAGSLLSVADQSVTVAGGRAVTGKQVATLVLAGQELLAPRGGDTKVTLGADSQLAQHFTGFVKDAYQGQPVAQAQAFQAFRAYYAARAGQRGLIGQKELDTDLADEAAMAVTGGIAEVNDRNVVLPWGLSEAQFVSQAERVWPQFADMAGLPASTPFARVSFTPAGGDRYFVMAGDTPLKNAKNGAPLVMVIGRPKPALPQGSTSTMSDSMAMGYGF